MGDFKYYHYDPSVAVAAVVAVLFGLTTVLHSYQIFRTKTWYWTPFIIGGYFETVGYAARAVSANQTPNWTLTPYLVHTLLVLVAPVLFAASIYMELGRIMMVTGREDLSIIKRSLMTKVFVIGDIISFQLQGAGGGLLGSGNANSAKIGKWVIIIGLVIQLVFFTLFITAIFVFDRRTRSVQLNCPVPRAKWYRHIIVLYVASGLIMIRSIFRLAEYANGQDGYLMSKEVFLYIFDALLMFSVMAIFNSMHPSQIKAWLRGGKATKHAVKLVDAEEL